MNDDVVKNKEKKNKKIALIVMIAFCAMSLIFGVVGGVTKFIRFVNDTGENTEQNMQTPEEQEFSNGEFRIKKGSSVLGRYKCEHKACGYVYGNNDDSNYDLNTISIPGEYQIRNIINDKYVLLYDDEEGRSNHRNGGVRVYDFMNNKVIKEYKSIKNYNRSDFAFFIAQNSDGKWGVIKFEENNIVDVVAFNYDYIGVFVPNNEQIGGQSFFAGLKGEQWYIINTETGNEYSRDFKEPIVGYDGELVVTKADSIFKVYDVKGNLLFDNVVNYNFAGLGILVSNSAKDVKVFDAYSISLLFSQNYVQITALTAQDDGKELTVRVNNQEVYKKTDRNKSQRNVNGADYQLVVSSS